ncbi:hypothetical protein B0H14DRAFT_3059307 [Mycena olivaceomarginata]|nr:hypothetical protein B0H14DRAFT_3059307 [Mycena olivaceomarginata]
MPAGPNEPRRPKWYIKRWFTPHFRHSPHASGLLDWVQYLEPHIHVSGSQIEFYTSSMYPGRSSEGDYFGFSATSCGAETYYYLGLSATLCCAESYYLDSGGLSWIERDFAATLRCAESYYLGSGGLLWIERDLASRRIRLFGLWGIIMD